MWLVLRLRKDLYCVGWSIKLYSLSVARSEVYHHTTGAVQLCLVTMIAISKQNHKLKVTLLLLLPLILKFLLPDPLQAETDGQYRDNKNEQKTKRILKRILNNTSRGDV